MDIYRNHIARLYYWPQKLTIFQNHAAMAASSSSSSVVSVDLEKAADGDTATSAIFFSDSGAPSSWPVAKAITSTLASESEESLCALLDRHGVPTSEELILHRQVADEGVASLTILGEQIGQEIRIVL